MRFSPTIFATLLEVINRRTFKAIVDRHDGDAYDKSFGSWDHLVALVYAQLSGARSLRGLLESWNANVQHHYHLGCAALRRSTLSDAGKRRPVAVFAEAFGLVAAQLDRQTRRDGNLLLRLIDSTPIPLGKVCDWAKSNGRIRGMKMHMVYDPHTGKPHILDITHANVNDAEIGRTLTIEPGATYVFDKGYCHYGWWTSIDQAKALFVTRPKTNMGLEWLAEYQGPHPRGDGFVIVEDSWVHLSSKGHSKLPIPLRRIRLKRDNGQVITLITNDLIRSAVGIAALYKARWQIELLFRWIKQNLRITRFLGYNDNAIRLQLYAAMVAYALVRIAAATYRVSIPILRFIELIGRHLFERRQMAAIQKPPTVNPNKKKLKIDFNQYDFQYV